MTKFRRFMTICFLFFGVLLFAGASRAQTRPPIVEQLAKTYGLDSFGQLDAVRYTFNLELPALKVSLSRTWTWEPKTGQVTYESKDKDGKPVKVTYNRSHLNNAPANVKDEIEPGFVNDNYWFIFPFHVNWDTSAAVTVKEKQKLPLAKGTATLVSVKYPAEAGGYTPGDTWDLYVGSDGRVAQFIYHRGGPKKPSNVTTTWAGYKKAGPLLVSTEHRGTADGKAAHIFFSNVAFKLAGSDKWTDAQQEPRGLVPSIDVVCTPSLWNEDYLQPNTALRWTQDMTEDSTPPILGHALDQPYAFTPKNLIDDVRRSRQIPVGIVPPLCVLEFDGDITDWLVRDGIAKPFGPQACFHTSMFTMDLEGVTCGIIARTIGGPYAVLIAEQL